MRKLGLVATGVSLLSIQVASCGSTESEGGKQDSGAGGASGGVSADGAADQTGGGGGRVVCTSVASTSGLCSINYASCGDGNTYRIECSPKCTCSENGTPTASYDGAGACDPQASKCGWDLVQGCLTDASTRVALGEDCEPGVHCCIAGGIVKCASACGDGGAPGSGGSGSSDGGG